MSPFRAVLVLVLLPVVAAPPAHAVADLCLGQVPTIVGTADQDVTGTEGPDVIVATDATSITALGGDDRICVVRELRGKVLAGAGSDQVETVRAKYGVTVLLGSGSDTFVGGGANDTVNAGDADDLVAGLPLGADHISTGGGRDRVLTGANSSIDEVNADVIALGADADQVRVRGSFMPSIDGGRSPDQLFVRSRISGDWSIDAGTGAVSRNGTPMGPVTHVTTYELQKMSWDELTFLGGPKTDELWLSGLRSGRVGDDGPLAVDLGDGADYVWMRSEDVGTIAGGPGSDTLYVEGDKTTSPATALSADLEARTYRLTGRPLTHVPGFERHTFNEVNWSTVNGSAGTDRLTVWGCGNTIRGRGGDDNITGYACDHGPKLGDRIEGGPGNDKLTGSVYRDRLIGGPGRDYAMGGGGGDVCAVEIKEYCR